MALNPHFLQGSRGEQRLIQSLVNEHLKIYGVEVTFIPRKFVNQSSIIEEVQASKFDDNFLIEAYVENYDGYAGAGDVLTKFGMSLRDEVTLTISKERFEEFIAPFMEADDDIECKEFCLVLEDFDENNWVPFDQFDNPMTYDDTIQFMKDLGYFHAACWGEPVSDDAGLGPFRAHWQNLNDDYWENGETTWDKAVPKWEDVYGESLLSMVSDEVGETIKKLVDIYASKNGKKIQEELLKELQKRPRTITHGDARGNNIFKSKNDGSMGIIDWQMWVAGPASNEFGQVWFNSFSLDSGMIHRLDEMTSIYYEAMISKKPEIKDEYPYEVLLDDLKLLFINIWPEYLGFTVGSIDGYKDPEQLKSKENWREMMKRNMETVHYSGCLESFENFISKLDLSN